MGNETKKPESMTLKVKVTNVLLPSNAKSYDGTGEGRISIVTDTDFDTYDKNTGEKKVTNTFGINSYNLVQQIGLQCEPIALASALALGGEINPQIIALSLRGADLEITREYHAKGEARETDGEVYSQNCFTTKIVKCETHIAPLFARKLDELVTTAPAVVRKVTPNPFL